MDGATVYSLIEAQARQRPKAIALEAPGRYSITYAGLLRYVQVVMMVVRSTGTRPRSRVAVVLPGGPEMAITLLGLASGFTCVPLNPAFTRVEFEAKLRDLGVVLVIGEANAVTPARDAARALSIPVLELPINRVAESDVIQARRSPMFGPARHHKFYQPPEDGDFDETRFQEAFRELPIPEDTAVVLHTTGTTSASKIVPLTHRNVCTSAASICSSLELAEVDRCLCMLPQFHIGGLVDTLLAPIVSGGGTVCASGFNIDTFHRSVRQFQPTWFQGVPTTLHEILADARTARRGPLSPPLRFVRSVSAPLAPRLMQEFEETFEVPVIEIYGMTEAGPLITSNPMPPGIRKPGSVGVPSGAQVVILGDEGVPVPSRHIGEVAIRGPGVFGGYENNEEANRLSIRAGWFRTGDLGYLDEDGYLFLNGRANDVINRGGEKVSPQEVDSVLQEHPDVAFAVTFPLRHPTLGESIAAVVVPAGRCSPSERELKAWLAERMAKYKIPQRIVFRDRLPPSAAGKVRRRAMAELLEVDSTVDAVAPRDDLEAQLVAVWAELLPVERIGVRDNFFDIGGDSLTGVRMLEHVESLIGRKLPDRPFEELDTVERLASVIRETDGDMHRPCTHDQGGREEDLMSQVVLPALTRVVSVSRMPRLSSTSFLMEANGDAAGVPLYWCFNNLEMEMERLSAALGTEQRLVGMYSGSGLFDYTRPLVKAAAQLYVDQVSEIDSGREILLAGHCRGAAVAHDMALELLRTGRKVRLLLMEYFDGALLEYPSELTLLYGRSSYLAGYKAFNYGKIGWRERFAVPPNVVLIDGNHGTFWGDPYLRGFGLAVAEFIRGDRPSTM